jgi:hypothetical protein
VVVLNVTATPRIEGQNPIEPLKIYELDFILTGLLVMITLQPPQKKYLPTSISEDGTGIFFKVQRSWSTWARQSICCWPRK